MTQSESATTYIKQRGAALVVSLILLLVMTIMGVAAMNGARMEISMAGLVQEQELALRDSEWAHVAAELLIEDLVIVAGPHDFSASGDGYYWTGDVVTPDASDTDWVGKGYDFIVHEGSDVGADDGDEGIDDDQTSIIEYVGVYALNDGGQQEGGDGPIAGDQAFIYRVTTRSATGGKAVRIIETIYSTINQP
jgi:type IV pilus assembly protein PilX